MNWSDIPWRPSSRLLRQFAALWLAVLGGLACWHGWVRGHTTVALVLAGLAVTIGPLGLVKPQAVRLIFVTWMVLAFPVGWAVSRLVLGLLFYGLFTPVGLLFRLTGRDALCRDFRPDLPTYWTPKPAAAGVQSYFRPF